MLEKIRKTFHTDKWWGKTIFIALIYVLYWCIFYILFPYVIILFNGSNFGGVFLFVYIFVAVPIISFFIAPRLILKIFSVNKYTLYSVNFLLAIVIPFISLLLIFGYIFSNAHFVGF